MAKQKKCRTKKLSGIISRVFIQSPICNIFSFTCTTYQDPQSTSTNNRLPPIKGQRKSRWRPTLKQREKLEACWAQDQYPDRNTKQAIAAELEGVTAEQVNEIN